MIMGIQSRKFKSLTLFIGIILLFLVSCNADSEELDITIEKFQSCLKEQPEKIKGKICNAYVPWGSDISELVICLQNNKIIRKTYEKDKHGITYEINAFITCKDDRRISLRFNKSNSTGAYTITWIGEIVM